MNKIPFFLLLTSLPLTAFCETQAPSELLLTPFIGAKWGVQLADDDTYHGDAPYGALGGVYGGIQLTPEWRIDVGYQYSDDLFAEDTNVNINTTMVDAGLRYDWYIDEGVSLYGRIGFGFWDTTKETTLTTLDDQGIAPLYEVGMAAHINSDWRLNLGYQGVTGIGNQDIGEYDSHAIVAGVSYYFGEQGTTQTNTLQSELEHSVDPAPVANELETEETEGAKGAEDKDSLLLSGTTLVSTTQFEFESYSLENSEAVSATELTLILKANPNANVAVMGHTDSTGKSTYNKMLSLQRAESVATALESLGIENGKIIIEGVGEVKPIATNETAEGRAKNRRVEVYVVPTVYD